jgi:hypothetical protein
MEKEDNQQSTKTNGDTVRSRVPVEGETKKTIDPRRRIQMLVEPHLERRSGGGRSSNGEERSTREGGVAEDITIRQRRTEEKERRSLRGEKEGGETAP